MHSGSIVKQATATRTPSGAGRALSARPRSSAASSPSAPISRSRSAPPASRLVQAHSAADLILLADERLTMSANMAAATGEKRWIDRYKANLPLINRRHRGGRRAGAAGDRQALRRRDAVPRTTGWSQLEREPSPRCARRHGSRAGDPRRPGLRSATSEILSAGTARFVDGMIASVAAERVAVQQRAVIGDLCSCLLISIAGAAILWRVLNATSSGRRRRSSKRSARSRRWR